MSGYNADFISSCAGDGPRDLIQFCKYVQKEVSETGTLFFRTIKNAEKNYG